MYFTNHQNPLFDGDVPPQRREQRGFMHQRRSAPMYLPQSNHDRHPGYYDNQVPIDPSMMMGYPAGQTHPQPDDVVYRHSSPQTAGQTASDHTDNRHSLQRAIYSYEAKSQADKLKASYANPQPEGQDNWTNQQQGYPMLQPNFSRPSFSSEETGPQITHEPVFQVMDRGEQVASYLPYQNSNPTNGKRKSLGAKIVLRLMNVVMIGINLAGDWIQYKQWSETPDLSHDEDGGVISIDFALFSKSTSSSVECINETHAAVTAMAVLNGLGTLMAAIQIIDIIGETLKEYKGNWGFQLLHGWVESVFTMLLEEIPQAIVLLLLNTSCKMELSISIIGLVNMIMGMLKTSTRVETCKQQKDLCSSCSGQCCESKGCCEDCCMYECFVPCLCRTFICQPCAPPGVDSCRTEELIICPESRGCFNCSEYTEDPVSFKAMFERLAKLHGSLFSLNVVLLVLANLGLRIDILHKIASN